MINASDYPLAVGAVLRERRRTLRRTLQDVIDKAGLTISVNTLRAYEVGCRACPITTFDALCTALGLTARAVLAAVDAEYADHFYPEREPRGSTAPEDLPPVGPDTAAHREPLAYNEVAALKVHLGQALRREREACRRSVAHEVGPDGRHEKSLLSSIEQGQQSPAVETVHELCDAYDTEPEVREDLVRLTTLITDLASTTRKAPAMYRGSEREWAASLAEQHRALSVLAVGLHQIPEHLRIPAYHRHIVGACSSGLRAAAVTEALHRRTQALHGTCGFVFVVAEGALRQRIGTALQMAAQVRHIVHLAAVQGLTIAVLPADRSPAVTAPHDFVVYDGLRVVLPGVVGVTELTDDADISGYLAIVDGLMSASLVGSDADALLHDIAAGHDRAAGAPSMAFAIPWVLTPDTGPDPLRRPEGSDDARAAQAEDADPHQLGAGGASASRCGGGIAAR